MPILFHAGDYRYEFSNPSLLASVAKEFPSLDMVCAHFGGYSEWDKVNAYDGLDNVYFDTSSSLFFITPEKAVELIRHFGSDRFFFGTDYPMWNAQPEIDCMLEMALTEDEYRRIFWDNAANLFGL